MKKVKIIILLLIAGAVVFGIIKFATSTSEATGLDVNASSSQKMQNVRKHIQDDIVNRTDADYGKVTSSYDAIKKDIEYFFNDKKKEASNYTTCIQELNNAYMTRFDKYATAVFAGHQWPSGSMQNIRRDYKKLKDINFGGDRLNVIGNVLAQYDQLVAYNSRVTRCCGQTPSSPSSRFDVSEAYEILGSVLNVQGEIRNCPLYEKTRQQSVRNQIFSAHTSFLNKLIVNFENKSYSGNEYQGDAGSISDEVKNFENIAYADRGYKKSYSEINPVSSSVKSKLREISYKKRG